MPRLLAPPGRLANNARHEWRDRAGAKDGLAQEIVFEWLHNGERERIAAHIQGGRGDGFRLYTRKSAFPADPTGMWTVNVLTPQEQLLERLRFSVFDLQ